MDYYGLFPKFKFNRSLKKEELKHQLAQHKQTELDEQSIVPDMKVITLNSHYLELVDKYYSAKGFAEFVASFVFFGFSLLYLAVLLDTVPYLRWKFSSSEKMLLSMSLICIPVILFSFKLLKTEWFAWTHYPLRFDRRNRLVHVFRLNG